MAEKNELIGFDPLAWMNEKNEESEDDVSAQQSSAPVSSESHFVEQPEHESDDSSKEEVLDDSKITLDAVLNIQGVAQLYEKLSLVLEQQQHIEIDASAVTSVDTSTLQLLIVLKQSAVKADKVIDIDFPSDSFIEAAETLGLADLLGVHQAAAGFF